MSRLINHHHVPIHIDRIYPISDSRKDCLILRFLCCYFMGHLIKRFILLSDLFSFYPNPQPAECGDKKRQKIDEILGDNTSRGEEDRVIQEVQEANKTGCNPPPFLEKKRPEYKDIKEREGKASRSPEIVYKKDYIKGVREEGEL